MVNNIDGNQLLMQLRLAAQQAKADGAIPVENPSPANGEFSNLLTQSIDKVNELTQTSSDMAKAFELGDPNVNLPDVMIAKAKAGIAFEGMVQVRNKVVEAYQEIMRIQV